MESIPGVAVAVGVIVGVIVGVGVGVDVIVGVGEIVGVGVAVVIISWRAATHTAAVLYGPLDFSTPSTSKYHPSSQ